MIDLSDLSPFTVTPEAMRPASPQRRCFYCQNAVGARHRWDCVLVVRKVKLHVTFSFPDEPASFDLESGEPWKFDKHSIEFKYNEGSWCADNVAKDLRQGPENRKLAARILRYAWKHGCTCNICEIRVLEMAEEPYLRER